MRRLSLAVSFLVVYGLPAFASVEGTLSSATDRAITWIQAGLALVIIYCGIKMIQGHGMAIVGIVVAAAIMVSARDLATMIQ